jgi:hypothetical protein
LYAAGELLDAGFTTEELLKAGFDMQELSSGR